MKAKFDQYVHEFTDAQGVTRFAVAEWNEGANQFQCPLGETDRKLTGCTHEFGPLQYLGGYRDRRKAMRRARYLFGQREE